MKKLLVTFLMLVVLVNSVDTGKGFIVPLGSFNKETLEKIKKYERNEINFFKRKSDPGSSSSVPSSSRGILKKNKKNEKDMQQLASQLLAISLEGQSKKDQKDLDELPKKKQDPLEKLTQGMRNISLEKYKRKQKKVFKEIVLNLLKVTCQV